MADHFIFDRTYIHGTSTGGFRNGILAFAYDVAVIDSEISEIHAVADESHCFVSVSSQVRSRLTTIYSKPPASTSCSAKVRHRDHSTSTSPHRRDDHRELHP